MISIESSLRQLKHVSLEDIDNLKLLNRVDRKFILSKEEFFELSKEINSLNYNILSINNQIYQHYDTTYYDTSDLQLYLNHHNRRLNRLKIRIRKYASTGDTFLEIKKRVNRGGETRKKRMPIFNMILGEQEDQFVLKYSNLPANCLKPVAKTIFERVTLTSEKYKERITVDFDLSLIFDDHSIQLNDLIILEVKREKGSGHAGILAFLKEKRIHPTSISKYCLAVAMLNPNIKHNQFNPLLQKLKPHYNEHNA